ncbi:hypothetical protein [Brooklawnia cerclae]|uniref:Uncharacterized protein n=1 Tax=Brooklawnia cerclae TaxID=349934 RepID=A0ABX0SHK0_9ACTN|nr:hypothetical protein [Brooklawnia cerclae]
MPIRTTVFACLAAFMIGILGTPNTQPESPGSTRPADICWFWPSAPGCPKA